MIERYKSVCFFFIERFHRTCVEMKKKQRGNETLKCAEGNLFTCFAVFKVLQRYVCVCVCLCVKRLVMLDSTHEPMRRARRRRAFFFCFSCKNTPTFFLCPGIADVPTSPFSWPTHHLPQIACVRAAHQTPAPPSCSPSRWQPTAKTMLHRIRVHFCLRQLQRPQTERPKITLI